MKNTACTVLVLAACAFGFGEPALASSQAPPAAQGVTISEPTTVATLDMGRLKGEPSRRVVFTGNASRVFRWCVSNCRTAK
mgnify:CR=1 FL=1